MKYFFFIFVVTLLLGLTTQAGAQQPAAQGASASANNTSVKVAVIDSGAFYDSQRGIARLVAALKSVEQEFQPRRNELQGLEQRIQQLTDEINRTSSVADPKALQAKNEQLNQLKMDLKRKGEDAEDAYNKRMQAVLFPVLEDVEKALKAFVEQRGIQLVLDADKLEGGLLYVLESADITRDFIIEYNRRTPSTTPPQR